MAVQEAQLPVALVARPAFAAPRLRRRCLSEHEGRWQARRHSCDELRRPCVVLSGLLVACRSTPAVARRIRALEGARVRRRAGLQPLGDGKTTGAEVDSLAEKWRDFYHEDERDCEAGWGIDVLGDDTLIKRILEASPRKTRGCKPHLTDDVTIHYVAKLEDGTVIEDTRQQGKPFRFRVGHKQTIRGVEEAVMSMSKGETSLFYIDPELAYGAEGLEGTVPPDATLLYEIELVQFIDMDPEVDEFDEDVEIPPDLDKMGKNDLGPGGEDPQGRWRWERHGQVMVVVVPIDEETSAKDIDCLLLRNHISARLRGEVLFDGEPGLEINEDESDWEIKQDSSGQRCAFIQLLKSHEFQRWPPNLLKQTASNTR